MEHHDHTGHGHGHGRAFAIGIALNLLFVGIELTFGIIASSMALVADAGHNASDVLGLLLAWGASILARRAPTERRTYGFRRTSILAALANAVLLLVAVGAIAAQAIERFRYPQAVDGGTMIWVAAVGIVVNTVTALLFVKGSRGDLNIRGAFLHMAADAGVSAGVVLTGILIGVTGLLWLDPVVSLVIVAVITAGTWGLLRESFNLAVDAVPEGIDPIEVESFLSMQDGVDAVHDLHIWAMSTTESALTAHLVVPEAPANDSLISRLRDELDKRFGIGHVTIQLEGSHGDWCRNCG